MESSQVHMGAVVVRDLSCVVSNYRSNKSLDEYLKEQKVGRRGAACACLQAGALPRIATAGSAACLPTHFPTPPALP